MHNPKLSNMRTVLLLTVYCLPSLHLSREGGYFCMLCASWLTYIGCPHCTSATRVVISACFVHPGQHILAALSVRIFPYPMGPAKMTKCLLKGLADLS